MKIIHVLDSFFPDSLGGTENYVYFITKEMQRLGHDVFVVCSNKNSSTRYTYDGIEVIRFKISAEASHKELTRKIAPKGLDEFVSIIKKLSPDVVHFHTFNRAINTYHLRATNLLRIKTIFTAHQSGVFCLKGTMLGIDGMACDGNIGIKSCVECYLRQSLSTSKAYCLSTFTRVIEILGLSKLLPLPNFAYLHSNRKKELQEISQYSDCNVAISEWVYDTYILNGVKNVKLVKQGINPTFIVTPATSSKGHSILRLLFVGRVYPIKALDVLCEALNYVDKKRIEVTFACVCGDDEYSTKIKNTITGLPYFNWHENVPSEKVRELMNNSDLLVLPSQSEMSPLVVLEALACSLPVLGSSIAPITDIITDRHNGLLFKVNNAHSLAEQLTYVIDNPSILEELRKNIRPVRTLNDVTDDLLSIYKTLNN